VPDPDNPGNFITLPSDIELNAVFNMLNDDIKAQIENYLKYAMGLVPWRKSVVESPAGSQQVATTIAPEVPVDLGDLYWSERKKLLTIEYVKFINGHYFINMDKFNPKSSKAFDTAYGDAPPPDIVPSPGTNFVTMQMPHSNFYILYTLRKAWRQYQRKAKKNQIVYTAPTQGGTVVAGSPPLGTTAVTTSQTGSVASSGGNVGVYHGTNSSVAFIYIKDPLYIRAFIDKGYILETAKDANGNRDRVLTYKFFELNSKGKYVPVSFETFKDSFDGYSLDGYKFTDDKDKIDKLKGYYNDLKSSIPRVVVGGAANPAQISVNGGINFDAAQLSMQIKRDGNGVPLPVNFEDPDLINLQGLFPVILSFQLMAQSEVPHL